MSEQIEIGSFVKVARQVGYFEGRTELRSKLLAAMEPYGVIAQLTDAQAREALVAIMGVLLDSIVTEDEYRAKS